MHFFVLTIFHSLIVSIFLDVITLSFRMYIIHKLWERTNRIRLRTDSGRYFLVDGGVLCSCTLAGAADIESGSLQ